MASSSRRARRIAGCRPQSRKRPADDPTISHRRRRRAPGRSRPATVPRPSAATRASRQASVNVSAAAASSALNAPSRPAWVGRGRAAAGGQGRRPCPRPASSAPGRSPGPYRRGRRWPAGSPGPWSGSRRSAARRWWWPARAPVRVRGGQRRRARPPPGRPAAASRSAHSRPVTRVDRRAGGVHHDGRADRRAVGQLALGVAEAALEPAAHRPVPAPTTPRRRALGRGGGVRAAPRTPRVGPVPEGPAAAEVEDHRGRHDGHHLTRFRADREARCRPAPAPPSRRRPRPGRTRCRRSAPPRSPARPRSAGPAGRSPGCPAHRRGRPPRPPRPSVASTTVVPVSQPSPSAVWCPIRKPSIIPPLSGAGDQGPAPGWHR